LTNRKKEPGGAGRSEATAGPSSPVKSDGPVLPGDAPSDYERYIRVPEILALQKPEDKMSHPDELLFQVAHQSMEIWFKVVLQSIARAKIHIEKDEILEAHNMLRRVVSVVKLAKDSIHLLETMPNQDYHTIRLALGRGSGSESPGFNGILVDAPKLWRPFEAMMKRKGVSLDEIFAKPHTHVQEHMLAEALTDLDMYFHLWREDHLAMIKRVIGRDVHSLKGYSVHQLETDIQTQFYPELWAVRNRLTIAAGLTEYGGSAPK